MRRGSKVELKQKKMLARDSLPELFDLNFGLLIFSVNVYLCTSNLCFFFFFFFLAALLNQRFVSPSSIAIMFLDCPGEL